MVISNATMVFKYSSRVFYAGALREKLCCHSFCQAPRNMSCEAVNEMGPEMSSTHVSGKQCMKVDDECRRIVIELQLYSRPMPQSINWCSSRLRSLKWRHWTLVKRENHRENRIKNELDFKKLQFGTCAKNYVRHIYVCWMVESGCKLFFPCICNMQHCSYKIIGLSANEEWLSYACESVLGPLYIYIFTQKIYKWNCYCKKLACFTNHVHSCPVSRYCLFIIWIC